MDGISLDARREIAQRLAQVVREEGIRLLMAVESGSRAWGFPSPDSDYDVRFIYVRPWQDYLTLQPIRDVVERPIVDELDVSGWDIRKALGLLLRHNAVLAEWIESPIRYVTDDPAVERLANIADRYFDPRGYALHYASLGTNNVKRWPADAPSISAKRYFYALRPALCVRALRMVPERRPPMQLQQLIAITDLPPELVHQIDELVEMKGQQREKAGTRRSADIEALIIEELSRADEIPQRRQQPAFLEEADVLFREIVRAGI